MKFAVAFSLLLLLCISQVRADSMEVIRQCMATQQNLPDSTRDGATALDFCAATDVLSQDQTEMSRREALSDTINWLQQKQAEDPAAADAALTSCKTGAGQIYSELLTCMYGILGP